VRAEFDLLVTMHIRTHRCFIVYNRVHLQGSMFKDSGMNHFIGDWNFKSEKNGAGRLSIFYSMFNKGNKHDVTNDEWEEQHKNFLALTCPKK